MKNKFINSLLFIVIVASLLSTTAVFDFKPVKATPPSTGQDLCMAILVNDSVYVKSSYYDTDKHDDRQSKILSSLGSIEPLDGDNFIVLSTGIAGAELVTTEGDRNSTGDERGTWFRNKYSTPRDEVILEMELLVPKHMHTLWYYFMFISTEYPEYIGSPYNDRFTVTVDSPSKGISTFTCNVNNGSFEDEEFINLTGTGFDIYPVDGDPNNVDQVNTDYVEGKVDAGATAITWVGGERHPVTPQEKITVTFSIADQGDNQFDSAVFLDKVFFSGYAKTDVVAYKEASDLNKKPFEANDTVQYTVTIANVGNLDLMSDEDSNEFEDTIPENLEFVNGSVSASSGLAEYLESENKIIWNGDIPRESSIIINYQAIINSSAPNGTIIRNQGTVYYDSDEDGINDASELTDDVSIDDGIDKDGDQETDDDDPTEIIVLSFTPPSIGTEDFSDDAVSGPASQEYFERTWFETSNEKDGNSFEVVSGYHYSTDNSFKTQIRKSSGMQTWNYNLTELESNIDWWEIMFACGNASEAADLNITFKDKNGYDIAKFKFVYYEKGTMMPLDWVLKLYYYDFATGWQAFDTNWLKNYLYNGWYKLRIEKDQNQNLVYYLYQGDDELLDMQTGTKFPHTFTDLKTIEFSSSYDPLQCPMFFWDEHRIGLS